jgi:murein DD-endopeptidase MepM/ murein hydrolase activator NlpD
VDSLVHGLTDSESVGRRFSDLLWPLKGGGPGRGFSAAHRALDLCAEEGVGVRAAADGVILFAGSGLAGYGQAVVLQHRRGWVTVYGSLREVDVQPGAKVLRGEWLGRVGRVQPDDQPHLHFEWLDDGARRDPTPHLVGAPRNRVSP